MKSLIMATFLFFILFITPLTFSQPILSVDIDSEKRFATLEDAFYDFKLSPKNAYAYIL